MSESLDPRLNNVATALAALVPCPPVLDRDRLLFHAGRASAPQSWFWRMTAATTTSCAIVLAAVLLLRPVPVAADRVVYVQVAVQAPQPVSPKEDHTAPSAPLESEPPEPAYSWPSTPYTRLEDRLLRWGLDGLAEPSPPPAAPPETLKSLLQSL
jgi:hypothetical protein